LGIPWIRYSDAGIPKSDVSFPLRTLQAAGMVVEWSLNLRMTVGDLCSGIKEDIGVPTSVGMDFSARDLLNGIEKYQKFVTI
jgi:hypothetical protein